MEQSERYWCPSCERIHVDECDFFLLDNQKSPDSISLVTPAKTSSATGSLALECGAAGVTPSAPCVSRAGDLPALVILLVPYCLLSFNLFKVVICA